MNCVSPLHYTDISLTGHRLFTLHYCQFVGQVGLVLSLRCHWNVSRDIPVRNFHGEKDQTDAFIYLQSREQRNLATKDEFIFSNSLITKKALSHTPTEEMTSKCPWLPFALFSSFSDSSLFTSACETQLETGNSNRALHDSTYSGLSMSFLMTDTEWTEMFWQSPRSFCLEGDDREIRETHEETFFQSVVWNPTPVSDSAEHRVKNSANPYNQHVCTCTMSTYCGCFAF